MLLSVPCAAHYGQKLKLFITMFHLRLQLLLVFCYISCVVGDSEPAGSDFFPHYNGFNAHFPVHSPAVLPPHDLTALQQTHSLGTFQQHRFQKFPNTQFNSNEPPLLFSQQTEFGGEPSTQQFNQPPQRQPNFPTPQDHQRPQFPPQYSDNRNAPPVQFPDQPRQQQFQDQPRQQQFQDQRFAEQAVRNPPFQEQFRNKPFSEPPRIAQNPNQYQEPNRNLPPPPQIQRFPPSGPPSYVDQRNPPLPIQQPPSFSRQPTFEDTRGQSQQFLPTRAQAPFEESRPQNQFSQGRPQSPFELQNQFVSTRQQQQHQQQQQQHQQQQQQQQHQASAAFEDNRLHNQQGRPQIDDNKQQQFLQQPPFESRDPRFSSPTAPQLPPHIQYPQESFQPPIPTPPPQFNSNPPPVKFNPFPQQVKPELPSSPAFNPPTYQQNQNLPPPSEPPLSFNPNRKPAFLPTQFPKITDDSAQYHLNIVHRRPEIPTPAPLPPRPLLPLVPTEQQPQQQSTPPVPTDYVFQKSQEPNYFQNDITAAPSTPTPILHRTPPKSEIKEITINLNPTTSPPSTVDGKKPRKEKTQEELINEQIQKLLQSHNLEIVSKGVKEPAKADESGLQIPGLPDDLKNKFKIQLVNPDILNELKGSKSETGPAAAVTLPPIPELPDHIKKQYDIKLVQKEDLLKQFKIGGGGKLIANEDLISPLPSGGGNGTQVYLANGQQLEIVRFGKDKKGKPVLTGTTVIPTTTSTTTAKPPKELFEELAKGAIPPGADFELIKHTADGQTEKVKDINPSKKVTFVILEEQPDGSVKVQGVKGNAPAEKPEKEVESIIKKIKDGSLKLPPSKNVFSNEIPEPTTVRTYVTIPSADQSEEETTAFTTPNFDNYFTTPETRTTFVPTLPPSLPSSKKPKSKSRPNYRLESTTAYTSRKKSTRRRKPSSSTTPFYDYDEEDYNQRSSNYNGEGPLPQDVVGEESNLQPSRPLTTILQEHELNDMAKFLVQSGLDSILNETGPYTIFIPTDEAFEALQLQLGGSDRAEDKFRENPRLLSGLLLHHVVPGAFRVSDLQDEMTGVSLAGTQLRVNTYQGDSKKAANLVTINGAEISPTKRDISVPQGIAHAVDRVLFPLPVGDLVQTLQGDRDRRFTKFVKSIHASGLTELLTGSKTYTVFAPTDKAFGALTDEELDKLLAKREAARTIVLRHVVPGTLYSAGMNYYQVKESMERGQKITLIKQSGKVKANAAHVTTGNIPATNGVIHIVDSLL